MIVLIFSALSVSDMAFCLVLFREWKNKMSFHDP